MKFEEMLKKMFNYISGQLITEICRDEDTCLTISTITKNADVLESFRFEDEDIFKKRWCKIEKRIRQEERTNLMLELSELSKEEVLTKIAYFYTEYEIELLNK